jgi:hypothetical protein
MAIRKVPPASAGAAIEANSGIAAALKITRAVWPITVILSLQ